MDKTKDEAMEQLSKVLTIIPKQYIDTLLALRKKLEGKNVEWSIGGDLGEELMTVQVEPDCVEILTSEKGVEQIARALAEFKPSRVNFQTQKLPRTAKIGGKEYPVYIRSRYCDFNVGKTKVKIHGDLQYRIDDWDWGDKLEFTPVTVSIVGETIHVVPLSIVYELHQRLGWTDRAEKVKNVITRGRRKPEMGNAMKS